MDRTCVVILGMHRSGTSALAGVLRNLGVDFGSALIGANEWNPMGHFEMENVVAFNDRLLRHFRSRWKRSFALPANWRERMPAEFSSFKLDVPPGEPWGLKDPRMCRLVPVWRDILNRHGSSIRVVHCVREPSEVAASLYTRDQISCAAAYGLWIEHLCAAEADTRDLPRLFVRYEDLLLQSRETIARIAGFLHLEVTDAAVDFLEPSLRRSETGEAPPLCARLYRSIENDQELRPLVDEIQSLQRFREDAVRSEAPQHGWRATIRRMLS